MSSLLPTTIAVDFDGTCVTHAYPDIGRDIGAQRVLRRYVAAGGQLILWTMRSGEKLQAAIDWFAVNDIPLYAHQRHPGQHRWTSSPKCCASAYIDDAAIGCPLKSDGPDQRPYVDWDAIERMLFQ